MAEEETPWIELAECAMLDVLEDDERPDVDAFDLVQLLLPAALPIVTAAVRSELREEIAQEVEVDLPIADGALVKTIASFIRAGGVALEPPVS